MNRYSPAILTPLVFLLAQGLGTVMLFVTGLLTWPDLSISFDNQLFPLILMGTNILAVLGCYFLLHNIRFVTANDISSIKWRPGLLAIAGGVLGALSISVLTENVELPETMKQVSLAMSHSIWGLLTLVIVVPVTEELLFREAIVGEMLRRGADPWVSIIASALIFSALHLNLAQGLYALPLGIIFGIIYYKTGNIVLTALLHILNNGLVVVQMYTLGEDATDFSLSELYGSTLNAYIAMIFLGALCILLMKLFWDNYPVRE